MKLADLQKKLKPAKLDGYLVTRNNMLTRMSAMTKTCSAC